MGLRRKLLLLLLALASFAVLAATASIHAVRWQVNDAMNGFEQTMGRSVEVDKLGLELDRQMFYLRDFVKGNAAAAKSYFESYDAFYPRLKRTALFARDLRDGSQGNEILKLSDALKRESDRCLKLAEAGDPVAALAVVDGKLESELVPRLRSQLTRARAAIDEARNAATHQLSVTSSRTIALTVVIGCGAAILVVLGGMLIRRWLIAPIENLQQATRAFAAGDFDHRCDVPNPDELGRLGTALNDLAERVSEARLDLLASEGKHRSLFRNLRDAVVICDMDGMIREYHDGETQLLNVEDDTHVGRHLLEVWPEWQAVTADWPHALSSRRRRQRMHAPAVALLRDGGANECYADFLVYRIESGPHPEVAIVARDVTAWQRLQRRLRRAETMEAVGTLAGGLAHDFNNLLASVTATLDMLAEEAADSDHSERIVIALRACKQASALSKRLLNFASSAHGDPQRFRMGEMVDVIMSSLDPSFLEGIDVHLDLTQNLTVRMDRDQFTQVVLNLVRNAREAMSEGGSLQIRIESIQARDPEEGVEELTYAVLTIADSGVGIPPEVRQHIFEPLYTTKSRASRRGRGLGLAIVYSAVKNAGGFMRLTSRPGEGTCFYVHLPVVEGATVLPPAAQDAAQPAPEPGRRPSDTIDERHKA